MKNVKAKQSLENYKKALESLREAVTIEDLTNLELSGAIQNFEFCYELLWKTLQKYADSLGRKIVSPKEAFQFAREAGLIQDEKLWLDMIQDRNETVHTYDHEAAERIFAEVKNRYFKAFLEIDQKLSKIIE